MLTAQVKGLNVPIQFQQKTNHYNREGMFITTVSLVSKEELENQFKLFGKSVEGKSEPVSEILRRGETYITIPNRFSTEVLTVPLQELLQEYKDQDLDQLFVFIQNRFQPNSNETPLYPSDFVDQYRQLGVSEAQIQTLLLKEKRTRDT